MKPGHFHATCRKDKNAGKTPYPGSDRCDFEFTDRDEFVRHIRESHPKVYRDRPKEPVMFGVRRKPFGAPAVKYEKHEIEPGTWFTHIGRECQVIGATSSSRTRFLVRLPEDKKPYTREAYRYWYLGKDDHDAWLWELTAPTADILTLIRENAE